jgi:excisionase family DNA binding protein
MDHQIKDRLAVTVAEAARAIGISRSSMYAEINRGTIRTFKLAGRLLVPWAELDALIERWVRPEPNTEAEKDQLDAKDLTEEVE